MILIPLRSQTTIRLTQTLAIGLLLSCTGCSKKKIDGPRTADPVRLSIDDFASEDSSVNEPMNEPETVTQAPTSRQNSEMIRPAPRVADSVTLSRSTPPARPVEIANPSSLNASPTSTSSLQLLDAKIGDVNGKPIFTNSFFAPIQDRLLAESDRLSLNEWRASAGRIISQRLDGIIIDELLRAEALAALTPTQRVGLQAFLSNFRNNLLSENLGSSELASRRLLEEEGLTLDEALRQKEVDTLVQLTLIREINRRVNVSWRDIQQRYDRDIDKFAPPPSAVLRVIRAFKDETDVVSQIEQRLANGDSFKSVASSSLNNYSTDTQGVLKRVIEESYTETAFFGPAKLNEAAHQLSVGETVGPIEHGPSLYWILYEDNEQEIVSLYDAQLAIQRELTFERRETVRDQYLARLQNRARVSTRDQVLLRLFEIAEERYAPNN